MYLFGGICYYFFCALVYVVSYGVMILFLVPIVCSSVVVSCTFLVGVVIFVLFVEIPNFFSEITHSLSQ